VSRFRAEVKTGKTGTQRFGKNMRLVRIAFLGLPLVFAGFVSAQTLSPRPAAPSSNSQGSIRGQVVMPDGSPVGDAVKVTLKVPRGDRALIYTDHQGRFELGNLAAGEYTVEVEADRNPRFDISTEKVFVYRNAPVFVTISLKEKQAGNRVAADKTVSVGVLDQNVPSAAKREFDKATHLAKEGKTVESLAAYRRAIAIYPNYLMARNDLGTQLLGQGELNEAESEFRRALTIDPKAFNPTLNLGIVLVHLQRFGEAAEALRRAVSLQSNSAATRFYLGLALMGQDDLDGAQKEFIAAHELGGTAFSMALFQLGQVYLNKGERALALQAFEAYLREAPDAANAAQARTLVGVLR
jgi:Flp pilus assembly protein TadD